MVLLNIAYILFVSLLAFTNSQVEDIEVRAKEGTLKGTLLKSRNGKNYRAFYGIPFAKPPIGDLRFEVNRQTVTILVSRCLGGQGNRILTFFFF